ncbi:hypothetical protein CEP53_002949 [Fusarium sp. AF-6]|nr:hypothetical protein CEP53_002949 [Fusarium sp. AF-6]
MAQELPLRKNLRPRQGEPEDSAWIWGPGDENLVEDLKKSHPDIKVKPLSLDLASFANVRQAAETVLSWSDDDVPRIDVLVNNAGSIDRPYSLTGDGFEKQFQTNHLCHFLFTNLIMSKLLSDRAPRIINIGSVVHRHHNIRWTDYNFNEAYPGAIRMNFSSEVDDLAAMAKSMNIVDVTMGTKHMRGLGAIKRKNLDEGVATHVFAAFDPTIAEHNGAYLNDCHVADPYKEEVYPWATSKVSADMLWKLSEKLVGQEFCY